jgi:hypothetical protein
MPCPICDQKPMNCDCTPRERRMWREMQELQEEASGLLTADERAAIDRLIGFVSPSAEANTLRALLERTK